MLYPDTARSKETSCRVAREAGLGGEARKEVTAMREKKSPKLLDQMRTAIRVRHMSLHTEEAYCGWVKRFILFHGSKISSGTVPTVCPHGA